MASVTVTLRTPTKVLFDGPADKVRLKTDLGRVEILPGHATLVGTILFSKLYIHYGGKEEKFFLRQGSITVDENSHAIILANEADKEAELSITNMQEYLGYLVKQMETGTYNDYQMNFLMEQRSALEEGLKGEQE